ncbi:MAG: hypothetical protein LBD97_07520 [Bifidobacteriaceae bacterium]|nr:hypothetical protein [Bifidobacteriaceae bacterium]
MPKGSRRSKRTPRPLDVVRARGGAARRVEFPDGRARFVGPVTPAAKEYSCPGCGRRIARGQSQVAVWEADSLLGPEAALELRRHWHVTCAPLQAGHPHARD